MSESARLGGIKQDILILKMKLAHLCQILKMRFNRNLKL